MSRVICVVDGVQYSGDDIRHLREENEALREGMEGDYDLDAWLDWAVKANALRQQVNELEEKRDGWKINYDNLRTKYKQRGERMKWLRAELKKYCKIEPNYRWFDPETGEPL